VEEQMAMPGKKGRGMAKWLAMGFLLAALGVVGAVFSRDVPCLIQCAPATADLSAFLKDHGAAMQDQMARIHSGKVDAATLRKIEAEVVTMHQGAMQSGTSATVLPPRAEARDPNFLVQVTDYLSAPGGKTRAATPAASGWIEIAQAAPIPAAPAAQAAAPPSPVPLQDDRSFVGQKTCETCHQQEATNWAHTIHAKIFDLNPRTSTQAQGCEACHGPGSAHVKNPGDISTIISFSSKSRTPVPQQNAQCLSCHQGGERIFWHDSIHDTNNVSCSDCHNPMTNFAAHGLTARQSINDTCFQCHKIQRAEFQERSHMPLMEGKITCVDCHNPHGSTTAPLLKADSVNEVCYSCHADKRGPFIFEHAPVRENCLNCHSPHGSNFEALLTTPRPVLCQQCHSQDGHPAQLLTRGNLPMGPMPDPRLIATSCQTCHVNIHGSNDPSGARFER
jgi:DmsE family decaheme c-type cytochrome